LQAIADALQVAMYVHSASTGTEIIHGKGLNHYGIYRFNISIITRCLLRDIYCIVSLASGHIDPHLNAENVWHSGLLLILAVLNSINSAICALADIMQTTLQEAHVLHESM
jgi:hypothetical protein